MWSVGTAEGGAGADALEGLLGRGGDVVEATYDIWTDPPPKTYEYTSAATSGRYLLWPGQATCYGHAITPVGSKGYVGYVCNHAATKKHPSATCRDGGFVASLNDFQFVEVK